MTKGRDYKARDKDAKRVGFYLDADGNRTDDPGAAVRGEIFEYNEDDHPKRTWFFLRDVEIKWLPMSEAAFLLWVFVLLFSAWVVIGVLLRLL